MYWGRYLCFFLTFCFLGPTLTWIFGTFWDMVGTTPWVYPNSPLHYTTLEIIPLWGFGAFIFASLYDAFTEREWRLVLGAILPLFLGILWVVFYSVILQ